MRGRVAIWLVAGVLATGCAGATAPAVDRPSPGAEQSRERRTLRMGVRYEVDNLALKAIGPTNPIIVRRPFGASIALIDGTGTPRPYLAAALPRLNSDDWQVFPDGRMETRYTLRPNLTWHDGQPLTADDVVFAWKVYVAPGLSLFSPDPQGRIDEVVAPDERTVLIRWNTLFAEAGALRQNLLDPLPRHSLERPFAAYLEDPAARDGFVNHPFWTAEHVGAGPFRVARWEPGNAFEGEAFEGHALGRPRIDRLVIRVIQDENTTLTNVLAGNLDLTMTNALRFEHGLVLQLDWEASGNGRVLIRPSAVVASAVQFRPAYLKTPGLLDLRVRRAMAHSIDRASINDGIFNGQGFPADTVVNSQVPHFPAVDRAVMKYPYDPGRTEDLMAEAGFTRDREGLFVDARGERFRPSFWVTSGPQFERHQVLMVETWKRTGIDTEPYVMPVAVSRDNEVRATFPGLAHIGTGSSEEQIFSAFLGSQIGSSANRWRGNNRTGWSSPELDLLWDAYNTTLVPAERDRQAVEMARVISEQIPAFPLYSEPNVISHVSRLRGYDVGVANTLSNWNIHEWELE